ncbi:MAG: hypothetical protein BRD55_08860 [Bacteroidetes bacterium SW_9_63_38]|nr:MAG: hypothetical protein BRD55_08860 [Bacteroidetes bacterium SW_9_63_38]
MILLSMSCQTVREVTNLNDVQFRIDRVADARLAGIQLSGIQTYEDFGAADVAQLTSALAQGRLPLSFTLFVEAENPPLNSVDARLTKMDWTLLLEDQETIAGAFDRRCAFRRERRRTCR